MSPLCQILLHHLKFEFVGNANGRNAANLALPAAIYKSLGKCAV